MPSSKRETKQQREVPKTVEKDEIRVRMLKSDWKKKKKKESWKTK
jgi:hypothetical protein